MTTCILNREVLFSLYIHTYYMYIYATFARLIITAEKVLSFDVVDVVMIIQTLFGGKQYVNCHRSHLTVDPGIDLFRLVRAIGRLSE